VVSTGGAVTAKATATDANAADTLSYDWSATSNLLADTDNNAADAMRVFNPATLSGTQKVLVKVTDSAGASVNVQLEFVVVTTAPVLSSTADTDGDGTNDLAEGSGDSNGNGIPEYLEVTRPLNVLPQTSVNQSSYLLECDPGVLCGLGSAALKGSSGGAQVLNIEIGGSDLLADKVFTPVGGVFDFVAKNLPVPGQNVRVVIPQLAPIPANAVYRKFQNGQWVTFVENANNSLHSTLGTAGYCPPPGVSDWQPGLIAGNLCVQVTLQDGGPNDADRIVNAAIADPGVVSKPVVEEPPVVIPPEVTVVGIKAKGSGGAMGVMWLLILSGFLLMKRSSKKIAVLTAALLASFNSSASSSTNDVNHHYLRADIFHVTNDQSQVDFQNRLPEKNYRVAINSYDTSRLGAQLSYGYEWNDTMASEVGYLDLGRLDVDVTATGTESLAVVERDLNRHYPLTASGFTFTQVFNYSLTNTWDFSGEIGFFIWHGSDKLNTGRTFDHDGADPLVGLRVEYRLSENVQLGLALRRVQLDDQSAALWSVSTRWVF
jgi:large repetitive protein